jgi:hypothetical protein
VLLSLSIDAQKMQLWDFFSFPLFVFFDSIHFIDDQVVANTRFLLPTLAADADSNDDDRLVYWLTSVAA